MSNFYVTKLDFTDPHLWSGIGIVFSTQYHATLVECFCYSARLCFLLMNLVWVQAATSFSGCIIDEDINIRY